MTNWSIAAYDEQPSYPVDHPKFEILKQSICRLCSRAATSHKVDVPSYIETHLLTLTLMTTGEPTPDDDVDLRFIQALAEYVVRGEQVVATPPWTYYSEVFHTSEPETGLPFRFEVCAVLWPPNAANDAIATYIRTFESINDEVHQFGFRLAYADVGKPLMCLERALRPDIYLDEILN